MVEQVSAPRSATTRARLIRPIRYALALTLVPMALPLLVAPAASADALPGSSPAACAGADCPAAFPPAGNGPDASSDLGTADPAWSSVPADGHAATADAAPTGQTQTDPMRFDPMRSEDTRSNDMQSGDTQSGDTQSGASAAAPTDEKQGDASQSGGTQSAGQWGDDTQTGSTSVHKVDAYTHDPVAGAVFQLWHETNGVPGLQSEGYDPDTKVGAPCVTPASGICSADHLQLGTYYWQEVTPPPGYDPSDRSPFTVVIDCDHLNVDVWAKDHRTVVQYGSTSEEKVDGRTGRPLAGATFQLWHETNGIPGLQTMGANPDTKVGAPCVTPASGICSADHLQLGTYYWQETSAPPGYNLPDHATFTVVIDCDHLNVDVTVKDYRRMIPTGSTSVKKVDARTGRPLAGATFQLWHETNGIPGLQTTGGNPDTEVGAPCVTPASGICSADNLELGTYYWQETAAPPGFNLPDQPVKTVVLDTYDKHVDVVAKDYRSKMRRGFTSVKKVDARTGKPLAGATFQLWHETNGIPGLQTTGANPDTEVGAPCVTPASGICSADNLELGTYYWQETAAPHGYRVSRHPVRTVVLDKKNPCAEITFKDYKHGRHHGHLPQTGFEGGMFMLLGFGLLGAGGLATAAARRRGFSRR